MFEPEPKIVTWQAGIAGRRRRCRDDPRDIDREGEDALQARTGAQQDAVTAEHREQQADECEQQVNFGVLSTYSSTRLDGFGF